MPTKLFSPADFLDWQARIELLHTDVTPRFLHARICYEVKNLPVHRFKTDTHHMLA